MAIPEGYEKLAAIGIAFKGEYKSDAAYKTLNAVYYSGSTFVALKDNPVTPPVADNANWMYMAQGFTEGVLAAVNAEDASGVLGTVGTEVNAQTLMDAIADKVMNKLIAKEMIVDNLLATEAGTILGAPQGKVLDDKIVANSDSIDELTRNLEHKIWGDLLLGVTASVKVPILFYDGTEMNANNDRHVGHYRIDLITATGKSNACSSYIVRFIASAQKINSVYEGSADNTPILTVGTNGNLYVNLLSQTAAAGVCFGVTRMGN